MPAVQPDQGKHDQLDTDRCKLTKFFQQVMDTATPPCPYILLDTIDVLTHRRSSRRRNLGRVWDANEAFRACHAYRHQQGASDPTFSWSGCASLHTVQRPFGSPTPQFGPIKSPPVLWSDALASRRLPEAPITGRGLWVDVSSIFAGNTVPTRPRTNET